MRSFIIAPAVALLVVNAGTTQAQSFDDGSGPATRPFSVSVGGLAALPQQEFDRYVNNGYGLGASLRYAPAGFGPLSLRADAGFVAYGNQRTRGCVGGTAGCRVRLDVSTSNTIFMAGVGPQLTMSRGPVRPYANGSVGLAYFLTQSSLDGSAGLSPFARASHFDDVTFAATGGAGVYVPISTRDRLVAIDLGASYHWNGRASYLREGSVRNGSDGSLTINPVRSKANLLAVHLGVSVGL